MTSITRLVSSFEVNSKEFESFMHDLMVDNNDVPFDGHEVDTVQNAFVKSVNSRINQSGRDFLPILDRILPTCSKDTFSQYGLFWIVNATKVLENVQSSVQDLILACKVLGVLVEQCKEIPELHKQISMQHVKQLLNILSALQQNAKYGAVYYLMAVLLYHYSEVCEKFQELIRKMILLQIDSTQENLVNASARCYVLLSKATERSFQPPPSKSIYTATTYNEVLLCNSLHAIMDELFSELIELGSVDIWDQLELPPISDENVIQYYKGQKQRFTNLCIYLSSMLRGYEARNSVLPHDILGVLCRGLAITPLNLKDKTSLKEQMLYVILPKMHISLLTILDAFINEFTQELVPYGATILQLFQQMLQWTGVVSENQTTFSDSKPFKNVRLYTYKCFCSWLINTSSLSGVETIENQCVTSILKDVTPERNCIVLSIQSNKQHLSKRAMKRFKHSQYENSAILNTGESSTKKGRLDPDLCREALVTLQNILFSGSVLLKQTFYKNVQNTVIPLLYNLYLDSVEQNFYKDHNICRLELFRVLKALQMNPHAALAFPVQYCLEISHMAAYDIDLSIAQEAKLASAELEKIIHPAAPTLQLPRQHESEQFDNLTPENQTEEVATTSRSYKRLWDKEKLVEACKRQKKIDTQHIEIEQNENDIELTEEKNNSIDMDKSHADNLCNEIEEQDQGEQTILRTLLNQAEKEEATTTSRSYIKHWDKEKIPALMKVKSATQHNEVEQNENDIELTEGKNNSMDVNKSHADDNSCEEVEEEEKRSRNLLHISPVSRKERELATHINTEEQKQHEQSEDLESHTDKMDETIEKSPNISEKAQKKASQDGNVREEFDDNMLKSLNLFHEKVNSSQ